MFKQPDLYIAEFHSRTTGKVAHTLTIVPPLDGFSDLLADFQQAHKNENLDEVIKIIPCWRDNDLMTTMDYRKMTEWVTLK